MKEVPKADALAALNATPRPLTRVMQDAGCKSTSRREAWQKALQGLVTEGLAFMRRKNTAQPGSASNPWLFALQGGETPEPETPAAKTYDEIRARTDELRRILDVNATAAERRWTAARLDLADAYEKHAAAVEAKHGPAIADAKMDVTKAVEASKTAEQRAKDAVWKLWRHQRTNGGRG